MAAAFMALLPLQHRCRSAQLIHGPGERNPLQLIWFKQGGEARHQLAVFQQELVREQSWQIKVRQFIAAILTSTDRFKTLTSEIALLEIRDA